MLTKIKTFISWFGGSKSPIAQGTMAAMVLGAAVFLMDRFATIAYVDAKTGGQAQVLQIVAEDARETRRMMWDLAQAKGVHTEGLKPPKLSELTAAAPPAPSKSKKKDSDS